MKSIATDYENNSEDFWNEIHRLSETNALAKLLVNTNEFYATDGEADEIEKWLTQIEGWDDPKAPKYAPYPILITYVDRDVFETVAGRELVSLSVDCESELSATIRNDDSITVFIEDDPADDETTEGQPTFMASSSVPDDDELKAVVEKITGRTVRNDPFGWHATGDSDQCYTGFRFEPIAFDSEEAAHAS